MHLFQRSFQSEKHWYNAFLGIFLSSTCDFVFITFIVEKRLPSKTVLCASGAETRFSVTAESNGMLCIPLQRNITEKLNCACAYSLTAEQNLLLILLHLRPALAPYWQSLVHLNCACSITTRYYLHKIDKIKMAGTSREISGVMTSAANSYNTRLYSSVRIKTRIRTEVT